MNSNINVNAQDQADQGSTVDANGSVVDPNDVPMVFVEVKVDENESNIKSTKNHAKKRVRDDEDEQQNDANGDEQDEEQNDDEEEEEASDAQESEESEDDDDEFICQAKTKKGTKCGKVFDDKRKFKKHQTIHSEDGKPKCPSCSRSFSDRPHLAQHEKHCKGAESVEPRSNSANGKSAHSSSGQKKPASASSSNSNANSSAKKVKREDDVKDPVARAGPATLNMQTLLSNIEHTVKRIVDQSRIDLLKDHYEITKYTFTYLKNTLKELNDRMEDHSAPSNRSKSSSKSSNRSEPLQSLIAATQ